MTGQKFVATKGVRNFSVNAHLCHRSPNTHVPTVNCRSLYSMRLACIAESSYYREFSISRNH